MYVNIETVDSVLMGLSVSDILMMGGDVGLTKCIQSICDNQSYVTLIYSSLIELFECMRVGVDLIQLGIEYDLQPDSSFPYQDNFLPENAGF